jgi:pimeloyl-ACP methyl ester carboxylesterase
MVGHSFGGFNVRVFAALHPTDVVGMVLVDSSREDQEQRLTGVSGGGQGTSPRLVLLAAMILVVHVLSLAVRLDNRCHPSAVP